jgi:hypothetical protein
MKWDLKLVGELRVGETISDMLTVRGTVVSALKV